MVGLRQIIKKLFFKDGKGAEPEESSNAVRSVLKTKYWNFKALLDINHKTLEIMSDMEHALQGGHGFGMAFIRANCTAISVNLYKIIDKINRISPGRWQELYDVFAKVQNEINRILEDRKDWKGGEMVLHLEVVNKNAIDHVGDKIANLGEIMNRVGLPVPQGFVITASAYELFMEYNGLRDKINQRLQSVKFEDMESLQNASINIQELIERSPLPPELEKAITDAYNLLEEKTEHGVHVSMRSSALGEDTQVASFAGQYRSELNISEEFLIPAYKQILASKYSLQAITYRLNKGFRDEDIAMCVGCMAMVEAVASGVMYSRDPGNTRNNVVIINAVPGLAMSVVDGSASPDLFVVSKEPAGRILTQEIHPKRQKFVCFSEGGIRPVALAEQKKDAPAITHEQTLFLAGVAVRLEDHYGAPQDIEWAIEEDGVVKILQSRPLKQVDTSARVIKEMPDVTIGQRVIMEGGVTASPGVACGPAFIVRTTSDALHFPQGAVLVTKYASPQWAALLDKAIALITDRGGIAGHLATVSREFGIPALFDADVATDKIRNGDTITVDADTRKVYEGKVEPLLKEAQTERLNPMKGTPVYSTLEKVLAHITPLNLTNPDGNNFTPQGCRTYHDITRFCHEKAVDAMFAFGGNNKQIKRAGKQLVVDVPLQYWVIDLGDGFKGPVEGDTVKLQDIASTPMLAIWEGMIAVPWDGPPAIDTKGFLSVMMESTMNRNLYSAGRSSYAQKNCIIISKNFCNFSCRFGYHFSVTQAFLSERPRENYIKFGFKGGAADLDRKLRRMKLIEEILTRFDFLVEIREDFIGAHIEGCDRDFLKERLRILGYLNIHTRQLDMIMANTARVNFYKDKILSDIRSLISVQSSF
ncbi:MAG: PEP/pyruvate-binding domain-containing protein [Pseudomonadota bacterium]